MNTITKTIGAIIIVIAAATGIYFLLQWQPPQAIPNPNPTPTQTGDTNITISNMTQGMQLSLPFTAQGVVAGNWFFEGSFPVFIKDMAGNTLGYGLASTPVDWMTPGVKNFTVNLPAVNYQGPAQIVFQKDNPSAEPQFDASFVVNVIIQ